MLLTFSVMVLTVVANLLLLGIVLFHKRYSLHESHVRAFSLSVAALLTWTIINYLADTSADPEQGLFWTRAAFPPALLMCVSIFWFALEFPQKHERGRIALGFYSIASFVSTVLICTQDSVLRSVEIDPKIGITHVEVGQSYVLIVGLLLTMIVHTTFLFLQNVRLQKGKTKDQIRYVLLGWSLFLTVALVTNAVLPLLLESAILSKFGPTASVFMVGCMVYAMVKHEFLDIKVIFQRGLIYLMLLSIFFVVYLGVVFFAQIAVTSTADKVVIMSGFLTTALSVVLTPYLVRFFNRVTHPWFFRSSYRYEEVMQQLSVVLHNGLDREVIQQESLKILKRELGLADIQFIQGDHAEYVEQHPCTIVIPVKNPSRDIGALLVGEKLSGESLYKQDIRLLETFSNQLGVALERVKLYEEVSMHVQTLEKKVADRTSEIQKLQKDQELMMLQLSHGLQTPLTIMKGELYLLRKQGILSANITTIDGSINRVSHFITRILRLYTTSKDSTEQSKEIVDMRALIASVHASMISYAETQSASITVSENHEASVYGIYEDLEEVLLNLVENALKYRSDQRKNSIDISSRRIGQSIHIEIRDTGVGISKDDIEHIFENFYRVAGERHRANGTGLGLAICRKIIHDHAGEIYVESTLGQGSTFRVVLPILH